MTIQPFRAKKDEDPVSSVCSAYRSRRPMGWDENGLPGLQKAVHPPQADRPPNEPSILCFTREHPSDILTCKDEFSSSAAATIADACCARVATSEHFGRHFLRTRERYSFTLDFTSGRARRSFC